MNEVINPIESYRYFSFQIPGYQEYPWSGIESKPTLFIGLLKNPPPLKNYATLKIFQKLSNLDSFFDRK